MAVGGRKSQQRKRKGEGCPNVQINFFVCIIPFLPTNLFASSNNKDFFNKSDIPILDKGYDFKYLNKDDYLVSCRYYVIKKFPANNIINFYDEKLLKFGFESDSNNKWECFYSNNGSKKIL